MRTCCYNFLFHMWQLFTIVPSVALGLSQTQFHTWDTLIASADTNLVVEMVLQPLGFFDIGVF